jgi:hypothetical protein
MPVTLGRGRQIPTLISRTREDEELSSHEIAFKVVDSDTAEMMIEKRSKSRHFD